MSLYGSSCTSSTACCFFRTRKLSSRPTDWAPVLSITRCGKILEELIQTVGLSAFPPPPQLVWHQGVRHLVNIYREKARGRVDMKNQKDRAF
ncbi:hypothetical protein F7725_025297 [Dissostichus mawsoni]|uniref:Uncharacterized protein n=1 Tax=Dissostichus mawsoni TaxID=36200 RepID=A0A7J5XB74_DISMA|nr:hypothetical protein F7725_025297 [Dissostichus mawsoni]